MMKIVDINIDKSWSRVFIVGLLPKISARMITASSESSSQNVLPLDRAKKLGE